MHIYIASSFKNHIINLQIAKALRKEGFSCFLPQDQAYNQPEAEYQETYNNLTSIVYQNNVKAIDEADFVLAIAHLIGTDTTWECGYAVAKGKPVILLELENESIFEMYMIYESVSLSSRLKIRDFSNKSLKSIAQKIGRIVHNQKKN